MYLKLKQKLPNLKKKTDKIDKAEKKWILSVEFRKKMRKSEGLKNAQLHG